MAAPKVDVGVLTIRDDEFRAVLNVFPDEVGSGVHKGKHREYALRYADAGSGARYTVGIVRQPEQGNGEAQEAARDMLEDLEPAMMLVVGIGGGLPSDDLTLGDVVLSTRIHDFTVEARKARSKTTYAISGGPVAREVAASIANLPARGRDLGMWTDALPHKPKIIWSRTGQIYGPQKWQRELREKLEVHHGKLAAPRAPIFAIGPIGSSDRLIKDPKVLFPWIETARNLLAVEMESGGVYRATRERCAMLSVRAISDIVGLTRSNAWTKYACASAAAFACAYLKTHPLSVQGSTGAAVPSQSEKPNDLVKYTYFLRSFADLQRWYKFRSDLKRKHDHIKRNVDKNMTAVLLHASDHSQPDLEEYFIRNPHTNAREGYHLTRGNNGEVRSGFPMSYEKTTELVHSLESLEREAQSRRWTWLPIPRDNRDGHQFQAYVIITDLADMELEHANERFMREYDLIIAEEVSKHGGEVAKSLFDGYVIVFDDEQEDRSGRLQQVVKCMYRVASLAAGAGLPQQRIVVDHENVRRVIRSHGYDTVSAAITRGRFLLDKTLRNHVIVSDKVKSRWKSLCSNDNSVSFVLSEIAGYWYMAHTQQRR